MAQLRNIRHERFVREYIANGGNGAEAYRRVARQYPRKVTGINNPDGFRVIACVIRRRPEVQKREQELRDTMAKKADITLEKILTDYQEALELAKAQLKPNDIVNAATAQAKLVGLLRDRVETGEVGDFDGIENISEVLAKVAEEAGPEAALALSKALGIDANEQTEADLAAAEPASDAVN